MTYYFKATRWGEGHIKVDKTFRTTEQIHVTSVDKTALLFKLERFMKSIQIFKKSFLCKAFEPHIRNQIIKTNNIIKCEVMLFIRAILSFCECLKVQLFSV